MNKNNLIVSNLLFITQIGEIKWEKEPMIDGYVYEKVLSDTRDLIFEIMEFNNRSYITIYMLIQTKNDIIKKFILADYNSSDVTYLHDLIVLNELQDELQSELGKKSK